MRRRQAASCKRQAANSGLHIREARGKRHAASSTHAASGMQPAAHLVLSFLLIGPAASFLVAVMVHSLPTGRFQNFSQDNVRTAVLAGGHCTGLWCLPVAAVCCRSPEALSACRVLLPALLCTRMHYYAGSRSLSWREGEEDTPIHIVAALDQVSTQLCRSQSHRMKS